MTHRNVSTKRLVVLLAAVAGVFLISLRGVAEPAAGKQDPLVARLVCGFLQHHHLTKPEIGEEMSKRLFHRFLKDLDPTKQYFLQSDIEDFRKHETGLADMLQQGDLSFAYSVYDRYVTRLAERVKLVEQLVNAPQDYKVKEYLSTDYDALPYAQNDEEIRDRWRKRIKFDLLLQRLGTKPVSEAEAKEKVLARYKGLLKRWKQVDNYDLMEMYLSALTTSADPHSTYMSPTTLADFDIAMRLNLEGIGALLHSENGTTTVSEVIPGGAAAKDGRLKPNDKIIGVAQGDSKFVDVVDMKLTEVVKLIRGDRGTQVQLKVIPVGKIEPIVYDLTRQTIELKSQEARADLVEQGKKPDGTPYRVGVIDLPSFYSDMGAARSGKGEFKSATEDVRKILKDFNTKRVDGVILDLRHNGGGALSEALALTGLFIDEGPIVQVKGSQGRVQRKGDPEKGTVYGGPLIVLVSRFSASASEILAGALQDYGRALIVGDPATHGKGTVQVVLDLGNQLRDDDPPKLGALKLTIQQFYRINGDSTQNRGVASDVVLPSFTDALATGEKDLEHALAFDKVQPAEHENLGMAPADVVAVLKARSAERVSKSAEFAKLIKNVQRFKERKERKAIALNEQELREYTKDDEADKAEEKANGLLPDSHSDATPYKFQRNFMNNEILQIMEDYLQGKKLAAAR
jgi:carboxyl-terminal processing protease